MVRWWEKLAKVSERFPPGGGGGVTCNAGRQGSLSWVAGKAPVPPLVQLPMGESPGMS